MGLKPGYCRDLFLKAIQNAKVEWGVKSWGGKSQMVAGVPALVTVNSPLSFWDTDF